ncbi:MAG: CesT family type III secretion system chaperone [Burkholderiaceae bacterium]
MTSTTFSSLMVALLKYMKIDSRVGQEHTDGVYTLIFDHDVKLCLFSVKPGCLDITSDAGSMTDMQSLEVLQALLDFNSFNEHDDPVSIFINHKSCSVCLWCRCSLAATDLPALLRQIRLMRDRFKQVQTCLKNTSDKAAMAASAQSRAAHRVRFHRVVLDS